MFKFWIDDCLIVVTFRLCVALYALTLKCRPTPHKHGLGACPLEARHPRFSPILGRDRAVTVMPRVDDRPPTLKLESFSAPVESNGVAINLAPSFITLIVNCLSVILYKSQNWVKQRAKPRHGRGAVLAANDGDCSARAATRRRVRANRFPDPISPQLFISSTPPSIPQHVNGVHQDGDASCNTACTANNLLLTATYSWHYD
jgi:hypothetical protein